MLHKQNYNLIVKQMSVCYVAVFQIHIAIKSLLNT